MALNSRIYSPLCNIGHGDGNERNSCPGRLNSQELDPSLLGWDLHVGSKWRRKQMATASFMYWVVG